MKKNNYFIVLILSILCFCCKPENSYKTDVKTIAKGQDVFNMQCAACHNFKNSGIGPNLSGVTVDVSYNNLQGFIENSQEKIEQGNERAVRLFEEYKTYMPNFEHLSKPDMEAVLAYLNTQNEVKKELPINAYGTPLKNPIPEKIKNSGKTLQLKFVMQMPITSAKPLTRINKIYAIPNSKRNFINDLNGVLYEMKEDEVVPVLEMNNHFDNFIKEPGLGTGFGSFTFHPEYLANGLFYTSHTEKANPKSPSDFSYQDSIPKYLTWILTEWKHHNPNKTKFIGTKRELMRVDMVTQIHGMQEITFNPISEKGDDDYGKLFICIGDGGSVENKYPSLTQDKSKVWGTILRIDPRGNNSKNGQYGIPKNNPFVNEKNAVDEIWAYGFRNPHRITWDINNGNMLASEIGHHQIEELNLIEKGRNYGWPKREGTFRMFTETNMQYVFPLNINESDNFAYPVVQFDHDEALAISGGLVYYGDFIPELKGKYIFGTITIGRVFVSDAKNFQLGKQAIIEELNIALDNKTTTLRALTERNRTDFRIDLDLDGELLVYTKADGKIYKVTGIK